MGLDTPMIGLCVSSYNTRKLCTAVFSDVTMLDGNSDPIPGEWDDNDIGIPYNAPEPMYVVLEDSSDSNGIVSHPDLDVTQISEWTEWRIDLNDFNDQGVELTDVNRMYIGFGDPCEGGSGEMYIDDIRLYGPTCILSERLPDFAKADYAPVSYSVSGDCVIDYQELEIMARDWLYGEDVIDTCNPGTDDLVAYYPFDEGEGSTTEDVVGDHNGTLSEEGVTWLSPGVMDGNAIHVDGTDGARVSIGTWNPAEGTGELTLAIWAKWAGPKDDPGGQAQGLICKRDDWDVNELQFTFEMDTPDAARGSFALRQHSSANTDVYTALGTMTPFIGRWAHLAATVDGTTARLYLNGKEVASGPFSFGDGTGAGMMIGNINSESGWDNCPGSFNGDLDEARIYNRALEPNEIAYLADLTPEDGKQHVPVPSPAELYDGEEPGSRRVNLRDFAILAEFWLKEQIWPTW